MEKKGLCDTCNNGDHCVLTAKFPVWQCEEFSNSATTPGVHANTMVKCNKGNGCSVEVASETEE